MPVLQRTPGVDDTKQRNRSVKRVQAVYSGGLVLLCLCTFLFWQAIQIRYPDYTTYNRELYALVEEQTNVKSQIDGNKE